jgi:hypothetical protein
MSTTLNMVEKATLLSISATIYMCFYGNHTHHLQPSYALVHKHVPFHPADSRRLGSAAVWRQAHSDCVLLGVVSGVPVDAWRCIQRYADSARSGLCGLGTRGTHSVSAHSTVKGACSAHAGWMRRRLLLDLEPAGALASSLARRASRWVLLEPACLHRSQVAAA